MKVLKFGIICGLLTLFPGCSSDNPDDPLEPFNRTVFTFNDTLDQYISKPIAKGYVAVVPADGRSMITNFFNNLKEPLRALNDLLQLNFDKAVDDMERMVANTTIGVFGFFDFADEALNIPMRRQDMGMTFAYWTNNASTPFLMIPFSGPSNVRDFLGNITTSNIVSLDQYQNIELGIQKSRSITLGKRENGIFVGTNRYTILNMVNTRANALKYEQLMLLQLDPYIAMKHAYENGRDQLFRELNS